MSDLKKIIKEETEKILHRKSRNSLQETKLSRLVKEEALAVLKEAKEKAPDIDKKLDEFRKKLIREGDITSVQRGMATSQTYARPVKRVSLEAVSKIIDVPINELLIHLLNTQRLQENQKCVYEYRGGMIDFFGELKEKTMLEGKQKVQELDTKTYMSAAKKRYKQGVDAQLDPEEWNKAMKDPHHNINYPKEKRTSAYWDKANKLRAHAADTQKKKDYVKKNPHLHTQGEKDVNELSPDTYQRAAAARDARADDIDKINRNHPLAIANRARATTDRRMGFQASDRAKEREDKKRFGGGRLAARVMQKPTDTMRAMRIGRNDKDKDAAYDNISKETVDMDVIRDSVQIPLLGKSKGQ